jgi:outer membrane lipoprotein-sorting protein
MAPIQPPRSEGDFGRYAEFEGADDGFGRRRKLVRYGVPVAIAGVAAATIGLGTALASTGSGPALPHLTAEQLLTKMATSHVRTLSGSVQISTDFGLPAGLDGGALGGASGGLLGQGTGAKGGPQGGSPADPQAKLTELLTGTHTLQVAADGPDRERVSITDNTAQYSLIHNGDQMWAYDSASNSVYHTAQDGKGGADAMHRRPDAKLPATPQDAVKQVLAKVDPTTSVTVDGTAEVAGRSAYQLLITPKPADSTIGSIRIAVDAQNGTPLRFTLTPKGSDTPAIDIGFTQVDFAKPAASTFDFTVPKGAKVTEGGAQETNQGDFNQGAFNQGDSPFSGAKMLGKGWDAVAELSPANGSSAGSKNAGLGLLGTLGHQVTGRFGSGTVISTRLVNVLIADNGAVYAGAVDQSALVKAADGAAR